MRGTRTTVAVFAAGLIVGACSSAWNATPVPAADAVGRRTLRVMAAFGRIDAEDASYGAWLALDPDGARLAAGALDAGTSDDAANGTLRSGLDGVLVAVKDNLDTRGLTTTAGSARLRDRVPLADATAVARVRSAGGIIVGKTNLDTFARGVRTISEVGGSTGNAWDPTRSPGGSSGGSAVAVARGMADVALGSDTCGSLRYPAAYNGVFGLRPTPGLVSRAGLVPLGPTQDVVGPMARSVADLAAVLDAIAGRDAADPLTAAAPRPTLPYAQTLDGPPARVGVVRSMGPFEKDRSGRTVLDVLEALGTELVAVTLPSLPNPNVIEDEYPAAKASFLADPLGRRPRPWLTGTIRVADPVGYARRLKERSVASARIVALLDAESLDTIVYPTTRSPAARRGASQPSGNCGLAATSGLPALALPHGLGVDGVPAVGADILGRPFAEVRLLQIGNAYELAAALTFPADAIPR